MPSPVSYLSHVLLDESSVDTHSPVLVLDHSYLHFPLQDDSGGKGVVRYYARCYAKNIRYRC